MLKRSWDISSYVGFHYLYTHTHILTQTYTHTHTHTDTHSLVLLLKRNIFYIHILDTFASGAHELYALHTITLIYYKLIINISFDSIRSV